jgi:hypothetical protein
MTGSALWRRFLFVSLRRGMSILLRMEEDVGEWDDQAGRFMLQVTALQ